MQEVVLFLIFVSIYILGILCGIYIEKQLQKAAKELAECYVKESKGCTCNKHNKEVK